MESTTKQTAEKQQANTNAVPDKTQRKSRETAEKHQGRTKQKGQSFQRSASNSTKKKKDIPP